MMNKIIVSGSDARMKSVYDVLAEHSYPAAYIDTPSGLYDNEEIILVLPPKPDIITVKEWSKAARISMIIGGACDRGLYDICADNKILLVDYLKDTKVTYENAILTAKGIIQQTISEHSALENKQCLVLGYGYCGKAIAVQLAKNNCKVTVAVRREALKEDIEGEGYGYTNINAIASPADYEYIYNTIPALVLDEARINLLNDKCIIYDIASKPGGTDFEYAKNKGIEAHLSLGIPGKMYPSEAGKIIAEFIIDLIKK